MSDLKVQWVCQGCPDGHAHVWQATVKTRSTGRGCPYCAGRAVCQHSSLATKAPQIAAEWNFEANHHTPHDYTSQSHAKVAWKCKSCSHAWRARIQHRTANGTGCPRCSRTHSKKIPKLPSLAATGPAAMAFWDHESNKQAGLDPTHITLSSHKFVHWLCTKCPLGLKHTWQQSPYQRKLATSTPRGCPYCAGSGGKQAKMCPDSPSQNWFHV